MSAVFTVYTAAVLPGQPGTMGELVDRFHTYEEYLDTFVSSEVSLGFCPRIVYVPTKTYIVPAHTIQARLNFNQNIHHHQPNTTSKSNLNTTKATLWTNLSWSP